MCSAYDSYSTLGARPTERIFSRVIPFCHAAINAQGNRDRFRKHMQSVDLSRVGLLNPQIIILTYSSKPAKGFSISGGRLINKNKSASILIKPFGRRIIVEL